MTNNIKDKANESATFWNKIAEKYAAQPVSDESSYQIKLKKTQALFTADMNVFEFGCGTGSTAISHAPFVKHYTAIDISENMIKIANSKLHQEKLENLDFKVAVMEDYLDQSEEYDAILGLSILHLLPNYKDIIQQVYSMLKPGGYFITNTVCLQDHLAFMKYIIPIMKFFGKAPSVEFIKRDEIESVMKLANFSIEDAWIPAKSKTTYFIICRKPL